MNNIVIYSLLVLGLLTALLLGGTVAQHVADSFGQIDSGLDSVSGNGNQP